MPGRREVTAELEPWFQPSNRWHGAEAHAEVSLKCKRPCFLCSLASFVQRYDAWAASRLNLFPVCRIWMCLVNSRTCCSKKNFLDLCDVWPVFLCLFMAQELEKALSEQDLDFLGDLLACLLQGCYQRNDITWVSVLVKFLSFWKNLTLKPLFISQTPSINRK